jgi:hypothetical protein
MPVAYGLHSIGCNNNFQIFSTKCQSAKRFWGQRRGAISRDFPDFVEEKSFGAKIFEKTNFFFRLEVIN